MKNNLTLIALFIFAFSISTLSNAQSIYKNKRDLNTENKDVQTNTNTKSSYSLAKFDKKHSLKANLISPFFNILTLFYNRYLTDETALQFGFSLMSDFKVNNSDERVLNCQAITAEYRYLLVGNHANGTYIQPFTRFVNANASVSFQKGYYDNNSNQWVSKKINYNESCLSAGVGFLLGVQNTVKNKLLFDIYAGPVYAIQINPSTSRPSEISESSSRGSLQDLIVKGYGIRAGFSVGFLF